MPLVRREDWDERIDAWNVASIVVEAHDQAFRGRLIGAGWIEIYRDADGAVLSSPIGLVDWRG